MVLATHLNSIAAAEFMPTGRSESILRIHRLIGQVAPFDTNVLILGESGTGKEVVARAIHAASRRASRPFVPINCGAIPSELLESELFGHEKGAFTGALAARKGRFEMAEGGTIFLDEIGDMPPAMQVKLLRVLQERCFERVGGTVTQRCDVRIIAATHRNLEESIAKGQFREDLYYRLNVVPVEMPPLRERSEDLPALIETLARRVAEAHAVRVVFSGAAMRALGEYRWPGNVRELSNLIERMAIQSNGETVGVADLPSRYRPSSWTPDFVDEPDSQPAPARRPQLELASSAAPMELAAEERAALLCPSEPAEVELPAGGLDLRQYIESLEERLISKALSAAEGTVAQAAVLLGLRRTTLVEKMRKYGLSGGARAALQQSGNLLPAATEI